MDLLKKIMINHHYMYWHSRKCSGDKGLTSQREKIVFLSNSDFSWHSKPFCEGLQKKILNFTVKILFASFFCLDKIS